MKKIAVPLLLCCVSYITYSQYNTDKPIAKQEKRAWLRTKTGQGISLASGNFTVHYYRCEWQIDPEVNFIQGTVTPYFIVTVPGSSVAFDFSSALTVDSILMRAEKLSFTQDANETLTVQLPSAYTSGQKDSISIYYKGTPSGGGFGSFVQSTHSGTPVIWTLSEPYGAKDWWPCRNGLDDKADSIDIYITHPSQYNASSNGVLIEKTEQGASMISHYRHRYPIASYLVAFAVTNFTVSTDFVKIGNTNLPVISYIYPEDSVYFHDNIQSTLNGLKLFGKKFTAYPFRKERYGLTQFGWGGGMEHQTNSFVINAGEGLVTHELAHQWFGDKVTCASWEDIWLNEGFATFCADFLYTEVYNPAQNLINIQSDLNNIVSQPDGSVKVDDTTSVNRIFDGRLSYDKGAFLLRMLRWTLGDSLFFKGVSNYLNDRKLKYGFARTSNLKRHLELISGQNLGYFFKQWYTGQGYPSFTVNWSQNANNKAVITLSQTTSHPSVPFFKVPLALTFRNAGNEKTVTVWFGRNNQTARIDVGFAADTVLIDKDHQLISKDNQSIHITTVDQPSYAVSVMPNPFKSTIQVRLRQMANEKLTLRVFSNTGELLGTSTANPLTNDENVSLSLPRDLLPGSYILQVSGKKFSIKHTLIKQ